jgi:hypothetical protein
MTQTYNQNGKTLSKQQSAVMPKEDQNLKMRYTKRIGTNMMTTMMMTIMVDT